MRVFVYLSLSSILSTSVCAKEHQQSTAFQTFTSNRTNRYSSASLPNKPHVKTAWIPSKTSSHTPKLASSNADNEDNPTKPKIVVFDLDGCLWRPEMYEILYFSAGKGAPFSVDPSDPSRLLTVGNEPVCLLGDIRNVMKELHCDSVWENTIVGISSRTDEPSWARELLKKFKVEMDDDKGVFTLDDVFQKGPIEIAKDAKIKHFERISRKYGVPMKDILFFDNELGNCRDVAALGVTVVYCPDGVTEEIWNLAVKDSFPRSDGTVVGL